MHTSTPVSASPEGVSLLGQWFKRGGWLRVFLSRLFRTPLAVVSVFILIVVVVMAVGAPWIATHDPNEIDVLERLIPPVWVAEGTPAYWLGTDSLGRDVFSRIVYGSRVSLAVGLAVMVLSGTLGVLLGLVAGYNGHSRLDDVIMRLADIQLAFPFLLLAIAVLAVLGPGLINLIIVLAISNWVPYARVVRAQTISLREKEFVLAARAIGQGPVKIVLRHILPNTWAPTIVIASFAIASTILAEAALSFLGLGVKPTVPTWGGMLAEGREHITTAWWIVTLPGLAIMLTVLCINVLGDWLRDYLDPRLKS